MGKARKLAPADRDYFATIAQAVFTNPFSDERDRLDSMILGGGDEPLPADRSHRLAMSVAARIAGLDVDTPATLDDFAGEDREILGLTFLFEIYHRHRDDFDRLIARQREAGLTSCPVPFAGEVLAALERRGFAPPEALRNFALYFQLRRAFFFIDQLVGRSPSMKDLRRSLWNNTFTSDIRWYNLYLWNRMEDFSTLLLGETGSGKGTAAWAIGSSGYIPFDPKKQCFVDSFTRTFVPINLSQFPEALIESELFGHRKGAFTGAVDDHKGIFSTCSPHGSIFLDEIGEVSVPIQIKLLRVLQERLFTPVGSHQEERFSGRVIAATNRPIDELRTSRLRDDFFYRLTSDIVVVPPLRQRLAEDPQELEDLVRHALRRMLGGDAEEVLGLVLETIERDLGPQYSWPGNVRELEQCVRSVLLKRRCVADTRPLTRGRRDELVQGIDAGRLDAARLVEEYCGLLYERYGSFEQVARLTNLDRRTVKKYVLRGKES